MKKEIAIIGGGPAGLMAAEVLATAGCSVTIYERKSSIGRKFLMAGRGGLNITHSEPLDRFLTRYGENQNILTPAIQSFTPDDLRAWSENLGQETFVGSSGRVFPKSLKASPLLRAWILRLENLGVTVNRQYDWTGWNDDGSLSFHTATGKIECLKPDATLLALGGASWPSLGSDGGWVKYLQAKQIPIASLRPSNCGFAVLWTPFFKEKFAGQPLKSISITFQKTTINGEIMIAQNGVEGGGIYALSSRLRDEIELHGTATLQIDLRPSSTHSDIVARLKTPRGKQSFASYLKKTLNLAPLSIALIHEAQNDCQNLSPESLADLIKAISLTLTAPFPLERAISTAGGVKFEAIDEDYMLKSLPGVFLAGEMLDWEAPTGGYLLQATFATGRAAACGMLKWLKIPLDRHAQ